MNRRIWPVALALGLALGCGGGAERDTASDAAGSPAGARPSSCQGTLGGPVAGAFSCMAIANFYPSGDGPLSDPKHSVVSVLVNDLDKSHRRPEGMKTLGVNVELPGEPQPGSYQMSELPQSGLIAHVAYADGRLAGKLKALSLTLAEVRFLNESELAGIKGRSYAVHGSVEFTVTDDDGANEASVAATF